MQTRFSFLQILFFFATGEYLALTGDKLNGVEMIACGLASHYAVNAVCSLTTVHCFVSLLLLLLISSAYNNDLPGQRLALIEERLGNLITDEPNVVETSLAQYGDLVYPDKTSVLHK